MPAIVPVNSNAAMKKLGGTLKRKNLNELSSLYISSEDEENYEENQNELSNNLASLLEDESPSYSLFNNTLRNSHNPK